MLEKAASLYGLNPKCLCTTDGKKVKEQEEILNGGAYVLVPYGQKFHESWYFLPDDALDTAFVSLSPVTLNSPSQGV